MEMIKIYHDQGFINLIYVYHYFEEQLFSITNSLVSILYSIFPSSYSYSFSFMQLVLVPFLRYDTEEVKSLVTFENNLCSELVGVQYMILGIELYIIFAFVITLFQSPPVTAKVAQWSNASLNYNFRSFLYFFIGRMPAFSDDMFCSSQPFILWLNKQEMH